MSDGRSGPLPRRVQRLLDRPAVAILLPALLSLVGSAAVGLGVQLREPQIHDEFSYLLAADTFAHGRLTNPPHPMGVHFETFHVLQRPTYASKYPPAQGLVLALGQVVTGHPIAGAWLSGALLCGALVWMLLAWFPVRWALLGGILAALRFGIVGTGVLADWTQSYWGGALAATGGALVLGSVPRLVRRSRVRDALWMGLGLAVLANSRPFEGVVASLPAAVVLGAHLLGRSRPDRRRVLARSVLPIVLVVGVAAGWLGYYNWRVTGHPLRLPYLVHEQTYAFVPLFLFSRLGPEPSYHHEQIRRFQRGYALEAYEEQRDPKRLRGAVARKLREPAVFFLGAGWLLALLALPWALRERWIRFCLATTLLSVGSLLISVGGHLPHYAAPVTGAVVALLVACLRVLDGLRWRGRALGRLLVVAVVLVTTLELMPRIRSFPDPPKHWSRARADLVRKLSAEGGRHLILVRYAADHDVHQEWVYNGADLAGSPVVWARAMDPAQDAELVAYLAERRAWLLDVSRDRIRLRAQPRATGP